MKNKTMISMLTAGALALAAQQGMANTITGQINMVGTATLNTTSLATATADVSNSGVIVVPTDNGSYAGLSGDAVTTFNGFSFTGGSATPLWSFTAGGLTYSFDLASDSIVSQSASFVNLAGVGTLNITGDPSVEGSWTFTLSSAGGASSPTFQFGFDASNNSVPDGGLTVALLGGALTAMALVRSKSRKL